MKSADFCASRIVHGVLVWACAIGGYSLLAVSVFFPLETQGFFKITAVLIAIVDFACIFLLWRTFTIEYSIYCCFNRGISFQKTAEPLCKIGCDFYSNKDPNSSFFLRLPWALVGFIYYIAVVVICSFLPKVATVTILVIPEAFTVAVILAFLVSILKMRFWRRGMDHITICIHPGLFTSVCQAHKHYKDIKNKALKEKTIAP